jgi:copper chaperone NosL
VTRRADAASAFVAVVALLACAPGTPEITYDVDACDFCRMTISDTRFGAAARSAGGRVLHFDSIECLAGWVAAQETPPREVWVTDAMAPGTLVPVAEVRFHRTSPGTSPMGRGYIAVGTGRVSTPWDGPVVSWTDLLDEVSRQGVAAPGGTPAPSVED